MTRIQEIHALFEENNHKQPSADRLHARRNSKRSPEDEPEPFRRVTVSFFWNPQPLLARLFTWNFNTQPL
ncbi:hypothetical protein HanPSC8_Chr11g0493391 [Helianthus annuus]|nr:hypothetical protein HanPSC8_Chr11g0493391 [Helianthus annuus]